MDDLAIDKFKKDIRFRDKIVHVETIPAKIAKYSKIAKLDDRIAKYLENKDIKLYKHQVESYNLIKDDENIIITTPTASGKTLAFNLPVLETLASDKKATALYIYPAKALSNDQLLVLKNLEKEMGLDIKPATYDGDTERSKKFSIRQNSRIVLTNPYQLHHILSWHHQWKKFYTNLKYVVIDEAHYYKGVFGSNVAFLIRRLKRIAKFYSSKPQFILSSATLANPKELASKLVGEDFYLIDEDSSPSGEKDFIFYNPYYKNLKKTEKKKKEKREKNLEEKLDENIDKGGNNKIAIPKRSKDLKSSQSLSIHQETENIFLYLLLKDVQTLCFTVSRKIAELIAMWAKKDIFHHKKRLIDKITAYRAGYLACERREIEEGLKNRKYLGVTCTNALELGINIGSLDAVIISGYPGTMISTWQQAGRSGRENQKSLVILVAFENQLDQYFMQNPHFFFDKPHENAIIDLNNNIIIKSHLLCAANELPITKEEADTIFASEFPKNTLTNLKDSGKSGVLKPRSVVGVKEKSSKVSKIMDTLENKKELIKNPTGFYVYAFDDQPSFNHSLDQLSTDVFKIMNNNQLLEVMERSQVYREAHEGAVLINKGETYIVDAVNLKTHYVNVSKRSVEFHTIVLKDTEINISKKVKREEVGDFTVNFGELEVSEDFYKYKKMHFSKTIGTYFLDLPPLKFKTKGIWFTIPEEVKKHLEDIHDEEDVFQGGLHGVEHALIGLFPLHVMCDRFDIGGLSTNYHEDTQEATIFIYDVYEGGIGICEKAIEVFRELVDSTDKLIKTCQCDDGCPSCIYSPKCGNENKPLHKDATSYILNYINDKIAIDDNFADSAEYEKLGIDKNTNVASKETVAIDKNSTSSSSEGSTVAVAIDKNTNVVNNETVAIDNELNNSYEELGNMDHNDINHDSVDDNDSTESENLKSQFNEAIGFYKKGQYTYAKDILVDIIATDRYCSNAWYFLGLILNHQGDVSGASNFLMKAISIDPSHEDANDLLKKIKMNICRNK